MNSNYKPTEKQLKIIQSIGYDNLNQFSVAIGISRTNICRYLNGNVSPTLAKCMQWATSAKTDLYTIASLFYPEEINQMKGEIQE